MASEATVCVEVDTNDILTLLTTKPHAGIDMMAVLARQFPALRADVATGSALMRRELERLVAMPGVPDFAVGILQHLLAQ